MPEITTGSLIIARPGRPTRAGAKSERRVNFRVTETEYLALKQMAAENRQPMANVIRDAVDCFIGDYSEKRVFKSSPPFE